MNVSHKDGDRASVKGVGVLNDPVRIAAEDVLKALKKFKRLAKQDLLASELMPNPEFWRRQAESRRRVYDELMDRVRDEGVATAYETALQAYAELPLLRADGQDRSEQAADVSGRRQAFEMFFHILGVSAPDAASAAASAEEGGAPSAPLSAEASV